MPELPLSAQSKALSIFEVTSPALLHLCVSDKDRVGESVIGLLRD
jgi:hypothetical protein